MSTGDQSLTSARARRQEMALDPEDLAARANFYDGLRERRRQQRSRRRTLVRSAIAVAGVALLATVGLMLWNSGAGSSAREELGAAGSELSAWAEAQVSGTAVAGPAEVPLVAVEPVAARVAGTEGRGVAVRDGCTVDARTGAVLREGTLVTILEPGAGPCAGWSLVEVPGGTSWISDRYLVAATRDSNTE